MSYEMYQCVYVGIARVILDFKAGIGAILKQNYFILSISIAVYFLLKRISKKLEGCYAYGMRHRVLFAKGKATCTSCVVIPKPNSKLTGGQKSKLTFSPPANC